LLVKPDADIIISKEKRNNRWTSEGYQKLSDCTPKDYGYANAMYYLKSRV
jgi:hypothetical protein